MPAALARLAALLMLLTLISASGPASAGREEPSKAAWPTALDASGDWPMYGHDPAHTNFNPAERIIGAGNVDLLVQRWRYKIGNSGTPTSGSPSVAGGRVYVGSSVASGHNFFSLDALTGARIWGADLHFTPGCLPVGIPSTSAISDEMVVVGGGDGAYYGLSTHDGALVWRHSFNAGPDAFSWASPVLAHGRAYVAIASRCDYPPVLGELRALDMYDGGVLSRQAFLPPGKRSAGIWNSPALSPDGTTLVVITGEEYDDHSGPYGRAILAVDPHTLRIWGGHRAGESTVDDDWASSPVIFGDARGRVLTGAVHKDGFFYAYLLDDVAAGPIWQRATGVGLGVMPAYDPTFGVGGTLFVATDRTLYALNPATGADRWPAVTISGAGGHMAIANGLIFLNLAGTLRILDEHTGRTLRSITPANAGCSLSGPVVANGFVYWLSGSYLNAWSLPDPAAPSTPTRTPAVRGSPTARLTPTPCPLAFADVDPGAYYYEAVRYLTCAGVVSGYADNTFRPFAETTRGQIAKIVVLAHGFPIVLPDEPTFVDVPQDSPFFPYIETIAARGVVSGYCDSSFRAWAGVTRGQLCKIIVAAAELPPVTPDRQTFADVGPDNPFYAEIETAQRHGFVSGYDDGTFRWSSRATRGQISKIVYSVIGGRADE